MNEEQMRELLYQALETEMGGIEVFAFVLSFSDSSHLPRSFRSAGLNE